MVGSPLNRIRSPTPLRRRPACDTVRATPMTDSVPRPGVLPAVGSASPNVNLVSTATASASIVSPLDERYASVMRPLAVHMSEYGLLKYRVAVEIELKRLRAGFHPLQM